MGARLPDVQTLIQAGINPKTGLPLKMGGRDLTKPDLKDNIRRALRIVDEQDAINRYTWYNLPDGLNSQLLERMLYYRGQVMFFYLKGTDQFFALPYALDGTVDVYGRFTGVTPVPYKGGTTIKQSDGTDRILPWLPGLKRKPAYEVMVEPEDNMEEEYCVILRDYTQQDNETIIARQVINDPIVDAISEAFPLARTNLINNCGVDGLRVNDEDAQGQVEAANRAVVDAALTGRKWVPTVANIEFQELTGNNAVKSEEFLMYMQSLDNLRLSLYGLDNGGLFQKKAHMLGAEQDMNSSNSGIILQDGLTIRQNFCDIVNSIFGLGIWCEISEVANGIDQNMDGEIQNDQDQSGEFAGEQPEEVQE